MLKGLIAFSFCAQLTWACVPVRPGEDMPCPSFPLAPASSLPGYLTEAPKPRNEGGAMVYSCTAPKKLIEVDGGTQNELDGGATLKCNANSGIFVGADGKAVGSKSYTCGEKKIDCPVFPDYAGAPVPNIKFDKTMPMDTANGDTVWSCPAPGKLYIAMDGMPPLELPTGASVICKRQSGMLTLSLNGETPLGPMNEFTCGTIECQTCDMAKLIDKTDANCNGQTDIFCDSKPMMMNDAMGCPMLSCAAGTELFVVTTAMASMRVLDATTVKCDKGTWMYDAIPLAATEVGFVCAKEANCKNCDLALPGFYDGADKTADPTQPPAPKPLCTYTCPSNHLLNVANNLHAQLVCRMDTNVFTVDTENGQMLSATNKFGCKACMCMDSAPELNNGEKGLCPKGSLCVPPTGVMGMSLCAANCKAGSTPIYLDKTMMKKTSADIKCVGGLDWITADKDADAGVTCEFAPGMGFSTTPLKQPDVTKECMALTEVACAGPAGICDFSQLVYVSDGMLGTNAICKKGELVTDKTPMTSITKVNCDPAGTWEQGVGKATCRVGAPQGADCLGTLPAALMNMVDYSCEMGVCWISCKDVTKKWEYFADLGMGAGPQKFNNQYLKCIDGEPWTVQVVFIGDTTTIACV